jgi:hypothetical protein
LWLHHLLLPEHARTTTILKTWKDRKKIIQLVWMVFFCFFFNLSIKIWIGLVFLALSGLFSFFRSKILVLY